MRHSSHHSKSHAAVHHKTKTHVVTNTQLAIAVVAAFLAGGLAFVATPHAPANPNACSVQTVEYGERCKGRRYKGTQFTCSDGSQGMLPENLCFNTSKIQKMVEDSCGARECRIPEAVEEQAVQNPEPVNQRVVAPMIEESIGCEVSNVRFLNRCARNQYNTLEVTCSDGVVGGPEVSCQSVGALQEEAVRFCAHRDCRVRDTSSQTDTTNPNFEPSSIPVTAAEPTPNTVSQEKENNPVFSGPRIKIEGPVTFEKNGGKVVLGVNFYNDGNEEARSDAKYRLEYLNREKEVVRNYNLEFGTPLKAGQRDIYTIVLPLPMGVEYVRATVDESISDRFSRSVTTDVPNEFLVPAT